MTTSVWTPAVDVLETGDDLVIRVELPGVGREDIDLRVENGTLTLRGERKRGFRAAEGRTFRLERNYGPFVRRFGLPTTVDAARIAARQANGVLEIVLPKLEEAKPKRIRVRAA